ncbi:MAG TPA: hypothetical protein VGQ42_14270 [Candidatus Dormibacteraeota bacterium]|jgi:hypothetical protein|nr:hypothetical protein [Candidatus Dormibacteraeota bacterium]
MTIRFKFVGLLGTAAVAAALAAAPTIRASAQVEMVLPSDAIVFSACTTSLTPVQPQGGGGSYTFDSNTGTCHGATAAVAPTCQGISFVTDLPDAGDPAGPCHINATGSYVNIVCGTGTTGGAPLGQSDTATVDAEGATAYVTLRYGITFVAGLGVITGNATAGDDAGGWALGVVQILPEVGNCVTPVSEFRANGVALVTDAMPVPLP